MITGLIDKVGARAFMFTTIGATVLFAGASTVAWFEGKRADTAETNLVAEKASHEVTKVQYRQAQRDATVIAVQLKTATEARDKARKERADAQLAQDRTADRRSADLYKRAHSVQSYCSTAGGARGDADRGGPGAPTQVADRPGGTSELVVVGHRDFDICTVNSRRLQNARDWALGQR